MGRAEELETDEKATKEFKGSIGMLTIAYHNLAVE